MTDETSARASDATLAVRGPASLTFLQGQLSQDLARVDAAPWSLLLAPDSAVITTCYVTSRDDGFDLVVPGALASAAQERLRRFLLRVECTVEVRDGGATPLSSDEDRVAAGWPGAPEFAAGLTPHSFGRHLVATTVSFDKGCFTGQELVGRLDARGASVPWRLVRASGPHRERLDAVLRSVGPAGPQGATTVVRRGDLVTALGWAHRTLLAGEGERAVDGVTVAAVD